MLMHLEESIRILSACADYSPFDPSVTAFLPLFILPSFPSCSLPRKGNLYGGKTTPPRFPCQPASVGGQLKGGSLREPESRKRESSENSLLAPSFTSLTAIQSLHS